MIISPIGLIMPRIFWMYPGQTMYLNIKYTWFLKMELYIIFKRFVSGLIRIDLLEVTTIIE